MISNDSYATQTCPGPISEHRNTGFDRVGTRLNRKTRGETSLPRGARRSRRRNWLILMPRSILDDIFLRWSFDVSRTFGFAATEEEPLAARRVTGIVFSMFVTVSTPN